jgi:hypothetical protein
MVGTAFGVAAAALVLGGVAMTVVAVLAWRRRLPRNRVAGVRTVNTMRDEETFAVGNQVGAPLTLAAGAVAVLGGVAVFAGRTVAVDVVLLVLTVLGALGLTVAGGVLGDRAASRVPMPRLDGGCSGVCAGCSLVDGCTGGAAPGGAGTEQRDAPAPRAS